MAVGAKCKCRAACLHCEDDEIVHCGVKTFQRLEDCLDRNFPDWKGWNTNYRKHMDQ